MKTLTKWTVAEYHAMVDKGILDHKRVELLQGELVEITPESPIHCYTMSHGNDYFQSLVKDRAVIYEGHPITLSQSEPEPDLVLAKLPKEQYRTKHPFAADILLLIEVSNSTLNYDLHDKKDVYEQEGIQEYWVIDIPNQRLHVFKDLIDDKYHSLIIHTDGTISPHAFPDVEIEVKKLFA
ncbi:Uma2 family endonuclease [Picosynechococcus sp. NKBG15041c]|uniref:Uma2 family endonuclease n=1 Tax=Picosynechococcus sp. NKBG15041c TaxID=1407650 RepID=UPI0003FBFC93|nr:Uma2 family endonuclease [Picosynechococcus sp. NKBG15041c]